MSLRKFAHAPATLGTKRFSDAGLLLSLSRAKVPEKKQYARCLSH